MPAVRTSLLIGSLEQLAAMSVSIDGNAATIAAGNWYLHHADPTLSLLDDLVAQALAEASLTLTAWVGRDMRVHLSAGGSFAISWTSIVLRDLYGFDANLSGQSSYTAANPSPLLFSPGWPATRAVPSGVAGYPVEDEVTEVNVDATQLDTDFHNTQVWDELRWVSVTRERIRAEPGDPAGGTWYEFRRQVLAPNHRFQLYESAIEDSSSDTAIDPSSALGTYKRRGLPSGKQDRRLAAADTLWNLGLEIIEQPEYD
jgi:hypothetical protein